jgi:hypothetical protein
MTRIEALFLLVSTTNGYEILALLDDMADGYTGPKRTSRTLASN